MLLLAFLSSLVPFSFFSLYNFPNQKSSFLINQSFPFCRPLLPCLFSHKSRSLILLLSSLYAFSSYNNLPFAFTSFSTHLLNYNALTTVTLPPAFTSLIKYFLLIPPPLAISSSFSSLGFPHLPLLHLYLRRVFPFSYRIFLLPSCRHMTPLSLSSSPSSSLPHSPFPHRFIFLLSSHSFSHPLHLHLLTIDSPLHSLFIFHFLTWVHFETLFSPCYLGLVLQSIQPVLVSSSYPSLSHSLLLIP